MVLSLSFSRCVDSAIRGSGRGEEPSGERLLRLIRIRLTASSLAKITRSSQDNSRRTRIADSSSTNAVNFSSARTTKRFPLPRCASATKIVRPLECTAETQPQTRYEKHWIHGYGLLGQSVTLLISGLRRYQNTSRTLRRSPNRSLGR